jgi:hypothetical protein
MKYAAKFGLALASSATIGKLDRAKADLAKHNELLGAETRERDDAIGHAATATDDFASAAELAKAEGAVVRAELRITNRAASIARTQERIATLTAEAAEENSAANRKATADAIEQHIVAKEAWDAEGLDWMARGGPINQRNVEINGADELSLAVLWTNLPKELPEAFAAQTQRLRLKARDVLSGHAPELLAKAPPAVAVSASDQITIVPTVALYSVMSPIVFTDVRDGKRKSVNRGGNCYLSAAQAELAIKRNKVVIFDAHDARQKANRSMSGSTLPEPLHLYDLDTDKSPDFSAAGMKTLHKAPTHTKFDPVEVFSPHPQLKQPYKVAVPLPSTAQPAAAAARSTNKKGETK